MWKKDHCWSSLVFFIEMSGLETNVSLVHLPCEWPRWIKTNCWSAQLFLFAQQRLVFFGKNITAIITNCQVSVPLLLFCMYESPLTVILSPIRVIVQRIPISKSDDTLVLAMHLHIIALWRAPIYRLFLDMAGGTTNICANYQNKFRYQWLNTQREGSLGLSFTMNNLFLSFLFGSFIFLMALFNMINFVVCFFPCWFLCGYTMWQEMLHLQEGTLLEGTVRKIFPYGAQIRIGDTKRR